MNLTSLPFTLLCNTFIIIFIKQTEIIKKTIKKFYIYKDKILTCNCQSLINTFFDNFNKIKKAIIKEKSAIASVKAKPKISHLK
jgi:hypothetical protein